MAIETVLCCFIADEEMFPADSRFAEGGLKSLLDSAAKSAATPKVFAVKSAGQRSAIYFIHFFGALEFDVSNYLCDFLFIFLT